METNKKTETRLSKNLSKKKYKKLLSKIKKLKKDIEKKKKRAEKIEKDIQFVQTEMNGLNETIDTIVYSGKKLKTQIDRMYMKKEKEKK